MELNKKIEQTADQARGMSDKSAEEKPLFRSKQTFIFLSFLYLILPKWSSPSLFLPLIPLLNLVSSVQS